MEELIANINAKAGGVVQTSINDEGQLVLSNSTGATIKVVDFSANNSRYDGGSGFFYGDTPILWPTPSQAPLN